MKLSSAPRPPTNASNSRVRTTLLVLVSCNLVLLLANLRPQPTIGVDTVPADARRRSAFEPIGFVASRLSVMASAYLSAAVYVGRHPILEELYSRMRQSWRRPAVTLLYIELFATATASLLLTLAAFARAARGAAQEALLVSGSVAALSYLGPVLFAYSDIVCRLGLVASVAEEGLSGMQALGRAGELVEGMKVEGLVLTIAMMIVEQTPFMVFGFETGGDRSIGGLVVAGPVQLLVKFFTYFACTIFYSECIKKRSRSSPPET